ncbi:hypothetical protein [Streptomyces sp. NPDC001833]
MTAPPGVLVAGAPAHRPPTARPPPAHRPPTAPAVEPGWKRMVEET